MEQGGHIINKKPELCRIGVISDTHGTVRPRVHRVFKGVDMILHAGDIDTPDVLIELGTIAQVSAIRGNMDSPDLFPHLTSQSVLSLGAATAVMIHDRERLALLPDDLALVVCGHTHQRLWGTLSDHIHGLPARRISPQYILNPGCGGNRTSSPSAAILTIDGSVITADFVDL